MILGADGERLSKRHGAVSVMQYREDGYLPEALVNYLARLGWSHGDEEVFSREQLVEWFDLEHVSKSPARFDPEKLKWLNAQYLKRRTDAQLAERLERAKPEVYKFARRRDGPDRDDALRRAPSSSTWPSTRPVLMSMAEPSHRRRGSRRSISTEAGRPALRELVPQALGAQSTGPRPRSARRSRRRSRRTGLKMPQLAMPLRVMLSRARRRRPSIDAVLSCSGASGAGAHGSVHRLTCVYRAGAS